jgi:arylsulfatase A-like enzyme
VVRNDLIMSLDMTAASLAAAGGEVPSTMHGRDMLARGYQGRPHQFAARDRCDIATERMRCVFDARYKYIRNFLPGIPYMQANPYKEKEYPTWNLVKELHTAGKLNTVQSLFAAPSKPVEELFDLENDPHEVNNLARDAAQAERLLAMRKLVDDWVKETGDHGATMEDPVDIYRSYFKSDRGW